MIDARSVTLTINGKITSLAAEPRTTLLDALREHLGMTGTRILHAEELAVALRAISSGTKLY